jgi:hypothetical protein
MSSLFSKTSIVHERLGMLKPEKSLPGIFPDPESIYPLSSHLPGGGVVVFGIIFFTSMGWDKQIDKYGRLP